MAQDLRKLFNEKNSSKSEVKMSNGHEMRFMELLDKQLPNDKPYFTFSFIKIAASIVVLLGLSYGFYSIFPEEKANNEEIVNADGGDNTLKSLADVSPDLKKVEDYYLASINLELSKLELTPENKELVDGYMVRLKELNDEYDRLTLEWNENGLNEETLDALISNLKLRLNLIVQLKKKLQEYSEDSFKEQSI